MKKNLFEDESKDEEKTDRYLITYADLITLLLGLFVILYASAQVDESKYKEMSSAFAEVFKSSGKQEVDGKGILPGHKQGVPNSILPHLRTKSLSELEDKAQEVLGTFIRNSGIKIQKTGESLVITLPELMLFSSGKADIQGDGQELLDSLASLLNGADMLISVDGHTDSNPIKSFRYESNWHLSTARALNVGYSLAGRGVPEQYLVIRGFGSQRPIGDNSTDDGRQRNRRVEITLTELPSDVPTEEGYNKNSNY